MFPSIFDGKFSAYAASKTIYTNSDTQGIGTGTKDSPYSKFEDALNNAEDGDTIIIEGRSILNENQDSRPFVINKKITIKSKTPGQLATLNNRRSGIVLHADAVFQDINIRLMGITLIFMQTAIT